MAAISESAETLDKEAQRVEALVRGSADPEEAAAAIREAFPGHRLPVAAATAWAAWRR